MKVNTLLTAAILPYIIFWKRSQFFLKRRKNEKENWVKLTQHEIPIDILCHKFYHFPVWNMFPANWGNEDCTSIRKMIIWLRYKYNVKKICLSIEGLGSGTDTHFSGSTRRNFLYQFSIVFFNLGKNVSLRIFVSKNAKLYNNDMKFQHST